MPTRRHCKYAKVSQSRTLFEIGSLHKLSGYHEGVYAAYRLRDHDWNDKASPPKWSLERLVSQVSRHHKNAIKPEKTLAYA